MEKKKNMTKSAKVIKATKLQTALLALVTLGTITSTYFSYSTYDALNKILSQDNQKAAQPTETISKKYAKNQTMEAALKTGKPIVALFYADWCGYCKKFSPTFAKITKEKDFKSNLAVAYVNGDDPNNREYMQKYEIGGFPTVYMIHPQKDIKEEVSNGELFTPNAEQRLLEIFIDFAKKHK